MPEEEEAFDVTNSLNYRFWPNFVNKSGKNMYDFVSGILYFGRVRKMDLIHLILKFCSVARVALS